jgi:hypothetical protein
MAERHTRTDEWAAITRRAVSNVGLVASRATEQIDEGRFGAAELLRYWTQMFDIAFLGAIELAEAALSDPVDHAPHMAASDPVAVGGEGIPRSLKLSSPFVRIGTSEYVPVDRITFAPGAGRDDAGQPLGMLSVGQDRFCVHIDSANLPSGIYGGEVTVVGPTSHAGKAGTIIGVFPVQIPV